MADSNISGHVLVATITWMCVRMFPKFKLFSEVQIPPVIQESVDNPLNAALQSWLSNTTLDMSNSASSKRPPGQDININITSIVIQERQQLLTENFESVHNGCGNSDVELKVPIFLDFRKRLQQDCEQLFMRNMKEDDYKDNIQVVPSSSSVFATMASVHKGVFTKLTRLFWRASGIEEGSTLQLGTWGVFYKTGEQFKLLKFADSHGIPEIHEVSQIAKRTLSIKGKNLRGADIAAVANEKIVPLTVFWPREELARESETLVATLGEESDGLEWPNTVILQAVKTLVEDERPILVRTERRLLELERPLTIALKGLLESVSPRLGWLIFVLAIMVGNFSSFLVNIFLNVPAVWMFTWFLVQLLPDGTVMYLKTCCTKVWEDVTAPAKPEVDNHNAFNSQGNAAETSSSAPVQGDNDIASQVPLSTKPMIGNLLLAEDSPAKFSALTEMHSAQLYWNNLDSTDNTTMDHNVSDAMLEISANSSARANPPEEVTVSVDRAEVKDNNNCTMNNDYASALSNRDSGSINAQTEVSWGYGSSRILQDNLSEAYSFPSIDDDDLIKFFPEKCEIEPAATIEAKPQLATQPASTSSPPSRFSVRSLIARLRATSPGNGGNTSNSSKSAVQTMSSVVISHRPDSASHTVVAAFDATRKLTFEAVDWGLLQMDLWPGDTLVVLGVITKIRSPLGVEVLADLDGFSGLNPRVLEHEVAQRLVDYQRKLLARRLYCQKKGLNLEVRITAGHPLRNVVAKEVLQLRATWVILDKHLAGPSRYCLQKCSCGVVLMNKKTNTGQFLRMAQQPSLTDPLYGGKYVKRQYTTAPIRFEDYHFEHPEELEMHSHSLGSPGPSAFGHSPLVSSDSLGSPGPSAFGHSPLVSSDSE